MNYNIFSIISSKLKDNQVKSICLLKDTQWKFGIKSQINWYNKNIKRNDVHILLYIKTKLIGYVLLRKRTCNINKMTVESKYLLFDTIIIDKKFRGKKLSNLLMRFTNTLTKQSGYFSFLMTHKEPVSFYEKFGWTKLKASNIFVKDHLFTGYGMTYNQNNLRDTKYYFYTKR